MDNRGANLEWKSPGSSETDAGVKRKACLSVPLVPVNLGYFDGDSNQVAKRVCVLVASYNFTGSATLSPREGNQSDLENLRKTFETNRKCKYLELPSPSEKDLLDFLENQQNKFKTKLKLEGNENPSVLILIILSHGGAEGRIFTENDSDDLTTYKVLESLKKSKVLEDSLKIVFFGACRGDLDDHIAATGHPTTSGIDNAYRVSSKPNKENFVIVYAAVETMMANRDLTRGTWLVQALCECLNDLAEDTSLIDLFTMLKWKIQIESTSNGDGDAQTVQVIYFPHRQLTINKCKEREVHKKHFSYPEKSESGQFWRKNVVIYCAKESYPLANDAQKSLRDQNFDTNRYTNLDKALKRFNDSVQCNSFDQVGVMFFCIFDNLSIDQDQHEQICAGGIPILDVVSGFIGSKDNKIAGKPKVFFFVDLTVENDSPRQRAMLKSVPSGTHYSGVMIVILTGKDAGTHLTNIFEKLKAEETLENAVHLEIEEIFNDGVAREISPQVISTIPFSLQFLPELYALLQLKATRVCKGGVSQPSDATYMSSDVDVFVRKFFKSGKCEEEEGDFKSTRGQIFLVSSAAGMGKSLLTSRFSRKCREQFPSKGNVFEIDLSGAYKYLEVPKITMEKLIQKTNRVECANLIKTWLICLDGFDEVSESNRMPLLELIETTLKDCPHINLWITTRPYEAPVLKEVFHSCSYLCIEIQPLNEKAQREMFSLSSESDGKIGSFEEFRKLVGSAAGLLETPNFFKMVIDLVEGESKRQQELNIFYVYEKLILKKLRKSLGRDNVSDELLRLAEVATLYLFKGPHEYSWLTDGGVIFLNKTGIISMDRDKKGVKFGHRTLAEFLVTRGILGLHRNPDETFSYALIFIDGSFDQCRYFLDQYFLSGKSMGQEDFDDVKKDFLTFLPRIGKEAFAEICCKGRYLGLFRLMELNTGDEIFSDIDNFISACESSEELAIELIDNGFKVESLFLERWCKDLIIILEHIFKNNFELLFEKICNRYPAERGKLFNFVDAYQNSFNVFRDYDGCCFLRMHCAVWYGAKRQMLELIMDNGGNISLYDWGGDAVLHVAAKCGNIEAVRYFIEEQALDPLQMSEKGQNCLHLAAENGNLETVNYLIALLKPNMIRYTTCEITRQTALHLAAGNGHLDVLKALCDAGADAKQNDNYGLTALHIAARKGHLPIVEYLVEKDPFLLHDKTISYCGQSALHLAAEYARDAVELYEYSIQKGLNPLKKCKEGKDFLDYAAQGGNVEAVNYFLANYPTRDINARSKGGKTALLLAVMYFNLEILKVLCAAKANVEVKDNKKRNALHLASRNGSLETAKWLVENYPSLLKGRTKAGRSALHFAAWVGDVSVVKYLIKRGLSPSERDNDDSNSLHLAVRCSNFKVVEFLLRLKPWIDLEATDRWGWKAVEYAEFTGKKDCLIIISRLLVVARNISLEEALRIREMCGCKDFIHG